MLPLEWPDLPVFAEGEEVTSQQPFRLELIAHSDVPPKRCILEENVRLDTWPAGFISRLANNEGHPREAMGFKFGSNSTFVKRSATGNMPKVPQILPAAISPIGDRMASERGNGGGILPDKSKWRLGILAYQCGGGNGTRMPTPVMQCPQFSSH